MKLKNKLLKGLLTANLALAGLGAITIPKVAVAETIDLFGTIEPTASVIDVEISKPSLDFSMRGNESSAVDSFVVM